MCVCVCVWRQPENRGAPPLVSSTPLEPVVAAARGQGGSPPLVSRALLEPVVAAARGQGGAATGEPHSSGACGRDPVCVRVTRVSTRLGWVCVLRQRASRGRHAGQPQERERVVCLVCVCVCL